MSTASQVSIPAIGTKIWEGLPSRGSLTHFCGRLGKSSENIAQQQASKGLGSNQLGSLNPDTRK